MLFPSKTNLRLQSLVGWIFGSAGTSVDGPTWNFLTVITIDRAGFDVQLKLLMRAITMFYGALDLFRQAFTRGDPNFIPLVRMIFPDFNIQHSRLPKGTLIDDAIYQVISRLLAGFPRQ